MEFRTKTHIAPSAVNIDHDSRILALGSCFAESISSRMKQYGLRVRVNPAGISFNPMSIASCLDMLFSGREITSNEIVHNGSVWCGFDFHGSFSGTDPDAVVRCMNDSLAEGRRALELSDTVILTFGTAWVYDLDREELLRYCPSCCPAGVEPRLPVTVSNCHKFPDKVFRRRRLEVNEIVETYSYILENILKDKTVIITVSPVRHLKDGLHGNNLSKSVLLLAAERLASRYSNVHYFPSYEILNDELRDYRFYADDMVHPSSVAVDYIWELFLPFAFVDHTRRLGERISRLYRASAHRTRGRNSAEIQNFATDMIREIKEIETAYPHLDIRELGIHFEDMIEG